MPEYQYNEYLKISFTEQEAAMLEEIKKAKMGVDGRKQMVLRSQNNPDPLIEELRELFGREG